MKIDTIQFINRATLIHKDKYNYANSNYIGMMKKLVIRCSVHGDFLQTPNNHLMGQGCPKCSLQRRILALSLSKSEFIANAIKIHGNKYSYDKVEYTGSVNLIIIGCLVHGDFLQTPNNHLSGNGCKRCAKNFKLTTDIFIEKATKIHSRAYDYSNTTFVNVRTKVKILCPRHGEFSQSPNSHLNGEGCRECWKEKIIKDRSSTTEEFVRRSTIVHNNYYDYSLTDYKNNREKVVIICPKHKEFSQCPGQHLLGVGCPICNLSKGELKIISYLTKNNIKFIRNKTFNECRNDKTNSPLRFDFYIPLKNMLVEYDGAQHFKCGMFGNYKFTNADVDNNKRRDTIKNEYALKSGIKLLRIKYTDFKNVEKILEKELNED